MKVSAARGDILGSLSIVNRGLSSRSTLPILSSVLLTASGETLTFQTTDLETSIRHEMSARIEQEGQAVIPGKLLNDIVRSLPEAAVTIHAEGRDQANVECEHSSFTVRTLHAEDFPKFPEISPEQTVSLPVDALESAVKQVARAASRDETRPVFTGVLTAVETNVLRMVATDSYRLAVREMDLDTPVGDFEVVIPAKTIEEIPKMAQGSETVDLGIAENQVVFTAGKTTYVSRRIEGKFPNYKQLMPTESNTTVSVDRIEFLEAVKRVSILAQQNVPLRIAVAPADATVTLSATTQDIGGATEALMVNAEGEEVEIAFNASFLAEGLSSCTTEAVTLDIVGPLKPGVLKAVGDERLTYILMPVRIG